MKNLKLNVSWIFFILGLSFSFFGIFIIFKNFAFIQLSKTTTGDVVRNVVSYGTRKSNVNQCPVINYTVQGQTYEFTGKTCSKQPTFEVGEKVEVIYDSKFPQRAQINSFGEMWFNAFIAGLLGALSTFLSGRFLKKYHIRLKLKHWLIKRGERVVVKIGRVRVNQALTHENRHPCVLECEWTDRSSGKTITAISDEFWPDPAILAQIKVGNEIEMLFDPANPERNYVIIDHLEKLKK